MNCKNCKYKFLCKDYGKVCNRYEKESLSEVIKKDNGIKEIRRID